MHGQEDRLADLLSGAAYRIRRLDKEVTAMDTAQLAGLFRSPVGAAIREIREVRSVIPRMKSLRVYHVPRQGFHKELSSAPGVTGR